LTASAAGASKTFTSTNNGSQNDLWQHEALDFTATGAHTTLSLLGASRVNYIGLDNVSVTLVTAAAPNATPSVRSSRPGRCFWPASPGLSLPPAPQRARRSPPDVLAGS
jgi:hypothetical protein